MIKREKTHINAEMIGDNSFLLKAVAASVALSRVPPMRTVEEVQKAAGSPISCTKPSPTEHSVCSHSTTNTSSHITDNTIDNIPSKERNKCEKCECEKCVD